MEDDRNFPINKSYAEKYDQWRRQEEIQKLKSRYGNVEIDDEDSSSSSSEDEDAEALTDQLEHDWMETLASLKRRDPKIYDKNVKFYHSEESSTDSSDNKEKEKSRKPMTVTDYDRKVILEKGGQLSDESSPEDEEEAVTRPGYFEEQDELRKRFKDALADSDSESEEDFLVKRKKTKEEKEEEDRKHNEWKETADAKHFASEIWQDTNLDDGEKFLRDYIVNKRYIDNETNRIPFYDEIVNNEDFSEEEEKIEKEELFERKYNFRFEEPDQEFIKNYPRTIGDSVRRKDSRRSEKRKVVHERKTMEKDKKKEEIKQLKNMKRKEIMQKLETIEEITGNKTIGFSEVDLEGDFDPKKYDQLMKKMFDQNYYDEEEQGEKPVLSKESREELGLDVDDWDHWEGPADTEDGEWMEEEEDADHQPHADDPDFVMDADFDPNAPQVIKESKKKKGKKKKTKFIQAVEKKKPVFDPNEKTFEEYFDEYYKLDYEDIIDDLPCRFRYRQVVPNDFGLSVDEVLKAKDKELNTWASLKKACQYRTEEEERIDVRIYRRKGKNAEKKYRILQSLVEEEKISRTSKKKKKIKKNEVDREFVGSAGSSHQVDTPPDTSHLIVNKGKKRLASHQNIAKDEFVSNKPSKMPKGNAVDTLVVKSDSQSNKKVKKHKGTQHLQSPVAARGFISKIELSQSSLPVRETISNAGKEVKKKKKKKKGGANKKQTLQLSDERLKAYGFDPKKFKYTQMAKLKQKEES